MKSYCIHVISIFKVFPFYPDIILFDFSSGAPCTRIWKFQIQVEVAELDFLFLLLRNSVIDKFPEGSAELKSEIVLRWIIRCLPGMLFSSAISIQLKFSKTVLEKFDCGFALRTLLKFRRFNFPVFSAKLWGKIFVEMHNFPYIFLNCWKLPASVETVNGPKNPATL